MKVADVNDRRKRLVIIDGKSVFYRGYYAMSGLSTKDGTPTGGVYGFAVMALEVIKRLKPDYVCVAWDKPKTNIRRRVEMYPAYKAGRKPPPQDFYDQIPILHSLLEAFGWPIYELDDYEADDIMGSLALQATAQDIETILITSDMDMLQLIDYHVSVYALKKGLSNIELFHPQSFIEKYGILPSQFLDLKAIKGDSSDNIPGVPGIGEKGAIDLLKQFHTLDGIYDNINLLKDSMKKKLEAGKELAYLSKKLASIWTDAPLKLDLGNLDIASFDPEKIRIKLEELEFRTLARQLPDFMNVLTDESVKKIEFTKLDVRELIEVNSDNVLKKWALPHSNKLIIQSEYGSDRNRIPLKIVLGFDKQVIVFDLKKLNPDLLKGILSTCFMTYPKVIGYDLKSTFRTLLSLGINLPVVEHDVLIGGFIIDSLSRSQSLSELANVNLGIYVDEAIINPAETTAIIDLLYQKQVKRLDDTPAFKKLVQSIEWKIIPVLASMEHEGILLDTNYLKLMSVQSDDMISDLEQQVYGFAEQEFNISSPSQLARVLFEDLKLPTIGIKKGKTGYSTAASELDKLRPYHPIIDMITQYREVTKLKSTYIDALPKLVDSKSRLHTNFALTIAQTGRLSSHDPNLQNIPVRTELGKRIRTAFIASEGNVLVSADYSQFELRLASVLADDREMMTAFNRDADIHTMTAAQVYGRDPEDVTKNMRREAKVVNFGIMYGLSTHGLVSATGMSYDQANSFIKKYFNARPTLKTYIDSIKQKAKEDGYVETMLGRRRLTPDVLSSNFAVREAAMRAAVNMPFQGSAADIMKLAMINIHKKLSGTQAKMLLQIHDSVLVECPEVEAKAIAELLKDTMEQAYKLPVKLTVDTVIGANWGEL
ncbi:DNA polymerase I [Candidatus Saccharibacteria bacterium]|nr:DNA polymerase I [Candidatus Saccharibacteria bacterium]